MFVASRLALAKRDFVPLLLRVHQAHPDHFGINLELGRMQRRRKNLPDALRYGQAAVALRPAAALAHWELGLTLHEAGRPGEAAAAFREALRLDPDYSGARLGLARSLAATGAHAEAAPEFDSWIGEGPGTHGVRPEYARCLKALGPHDDATRQYGHLIAVQRLTIDRDPGKGRL